MKQFSIRTNSILMIIRQICGILFSIVLSPYVHKTLGPANLGKITFVSSIISYFSLLASNGIGAYAVREGSKLRENKSKLSNFIDQMFSLRFLSTFVSYLLLLITFFLWKRLREHSVLLFFSSLSIFFSAISCEWLFRIFENYRFLSFKSILTNALTLILVLVFVKQNSDYIKYAFIMMLTDGLLCIVSFLIIRNYADPHISFANIDYSNHIRPITILFLNYLVSIIYTSSDITLLGIMKDSASVGIYGSTVNIYNTIKDIIVSFIVTSVPRLSHAAGLSDKMHFNLLAEKVYISLITLVLPSAVGLFLISKNVLLLFTSIEFLEGNGCLRILSITLLFSVVARFLTTCLLIPLHKEKIVLISSTLASVINFLLNLVLIPRFGIMGTAFTTLLSEMFIVLVCFYCSRDNVSFHFFSKDILVSILGCCGIIVVCNLVGIFNLNLITDTLLKVTLSVLVYAVILFINKQSVFCSMLNYMVQSCSMFFDKLKK